MTTAAQCCKAQGSSAVTGIKEAQIHGVVKMRLTQRKWTESNPKPYIDEVCVYDIFSGDGINFVDGEMVMGSPYEIHRAIVESGLWESKKVRFVASDIREQAIQQLATLLGEERRFLVDYRTGPAVDQIVNASERLRRNQRCHVMLIVDPNGPGTMPFTELLALAQTYGRRVDILLNVSETAICRILGCSITKDKNWWAGFDAFADVIRALLVHFKGGWLRQPLPGDRQRWRFICFWSYAPPPRGWLQQHLIPMDSTTDLNTILGR